MTSKSFLGGSSTASLPPNKELQRQIEREVEQTRRRESDAESEREQAGCEDENDASSRRPESQAGRWPG